MCNDIERSQFVNKIYGIEISSFELFLEGSSYTLREKGFKEFFWCYQPCQVCDLNHQDLFVEDLCSIFFFQRNNKKNFLILCSLSEILIVKLAIIYISLIRSITRVSPIQFFCFSEQLINAITYWPFIVIINKKNECMRSHLKQKYN